MTAFCAICIDRPATGPATIDGRTYQVCAGCDGGTPDPGEVYEPADISDGFTFSKGQSGETRNAIAWILRRAGRALTAGEICEAMGSEYVGAFGNAISKLLGRMVQRGELRREWVDPGNPSQGGLYSLAPGVPTFKPSPLDVAVIALAAIDDEASLTVDKLASEAGVCKSVAKRALVLTGFKAQRGRGKRSWLPPDEARSA